MQLASAPSCGAAVRRQLTPELVPYTQPAGAQCMCPCSPAPVPSLTSLPLCQVVEVAQPVVEQPTAEFFTKVSARWGAVACSACHVESQWGRATLEGWAAAHQLCGGRTNAIHKHARVLWSRGACVKLPKLPPRTASPPRQVEDRPVMKERVTRMREHHPVRRGRDGLPRMLTCGREQAALVAAAHLMPASRGCFPCISSNNPTSLPQPHLCPKGGEGVCGGDARHRRGEWRLKSGSRPRLKPLWGAAVPGLLCVACCASWSMFQRLDALNRANCRSARRGSAPRSTWAPPKRWWRWPSRGRLASKRSGVRTMRPCERTAGGSMVNGRGLADTQLA